MVGDRQNAQQSVRSVCKTTGRVHSPERRTISHPIHVPSWPRDYKENKEERFKKGKPTSIASQRPINPVLLLADRMFPTTASNPTTSLYPEEIDEDDLHEPAAVSLTDEASLEKDYCLVSSSEDEGWEIVAG